MRGPVYLWPAWLHVFMCSPRACACGHRHFRRDNHTRLPQPPNPTVDTVSNKRCWAKVGGMPYWPARRSTKADMPAAVRRKASPNDVFVVLYGLGKRVGVPPDCVEPWYGVDINPIPVSYRPYKKAVDRCVTEIQRERDKIAGRRARHAVKDRKQRCRRTGCRQVVPRLWLFCSPRCRHLHAAVLRLQHMKTFRARLVGEELDAQVAQHLSNKLRSQVRLHFEHTIKSAAAKDVERGNLSRGVLPPKKARRLGLKLEAELAALACVVLWRGGRSGCG